MIYQSLKFLKQKILGPILSIPRLRLIDKKIVSELLNNFNTLKSLIDIRSLKPATGLLRSIQLKNCEFTKEIIAELEQNGIKPFMIAGTLLGAERHKGYIPWDDDLDFGVIRDDYKKILEYSRKNFVVCYQNINKYRYNYSTRETIKKILLKYPNKTVLLIYPFLYKFIKGTSLSDYVQMDLFPFDYYKDDYKYSDFIKKTKKIIDKLWLINNTLKEIEFLNEQREKDSHIVEKSNKIFYGNDNCDAQNFETLNKCSDFMKTSDFFPLKRMQFEETEFWAPNNHIQYLENYIGKNWNSIPDNIIPPQIEEREG